MKPKAAMCAGFMLSLFVVADAFADYSLVNGKKDFYFGHISYTDEKITGEDCMVFREGETRGEVALLNVPLGPGDLIQSSAVRRCEIQFDNGSIVRLGLDTRLKIETILAPSLSRLEKLSNLVLERGEIYVMHKRWEPPEIFQVITPRAAVKLDHNAVASIRVNGAGSTEVQVETGKAHLLYGADKFHVRQQRIEAKQRWVLASDTKSDRAEYQTTSDFKSWNEDINLHFADLHRGTTLPKPIQTLPKAVFYFAQKYGNFYGEWLWHDLYGYVWRPYFNDHRYPWGNWSPYVNGRWATFRKELFWVPGEPWGWVPYHLGIWMWDKKTGWVWLPGSMFAPAWVAWDFYQGGIYAWRPLSLFEWMWSFWPQDQLAYLGDDVFWDHWSGVPRGYKPESPGAPRLSKSERAVHEKPNLPMPKGFERALRATKAALQRNDPNLLASLRSLPAYSTLVRKEDLLSADWRDRTVPFDRLIHESARPAEGSFSRISSADVWKDVAPPAEPSTTETVLAPPAAPPPIDRATFSMVETPIAVREFVQAWDEQVTARSTPRSRSDERQLRFRDWNPDVRIAIQIDVDITYSSRANAVVCPQLNLTSGTVSARTQNPFASGGRGGAAGGSNSTTATATSGAASTTGETTSTKGSSGGGSHTSTARRKN